MPIEISTFLDAVAPDAPIVILIMALAAMAEAAFGLGPFIPGETMVVTGTIILDDIGLRLLAWPAVAIGAFLGDQVGFLVGRRSGPALARSAVIRRIGVRRWERASGLVRQHGMIPLVIARLVPGVRTLIAAAAGASGIRYSRFALADGLAATLWSALWVFGGAAVGQAIGKATWMVIPIVVVSVVVGLIVRRRLRQRAALRLGAEAVEAAA